VVGLGLADDPRVEEVVVAARSAWRYEGPVTPDQLGVDSPDHVVVEVDRETGLILSWRELTPSGAVARELRTTRVESAAVAVGDGEAIAPRREPVEEDGGAPTTGARAAREVADDRSAFQLEPPAEVEAVRTDLGFHPVDPDELAALVGYAPLAPGEVPAGFELEAVWANGGEGRPIGPEGMLESSRITVLVWTSGLHRFTVTERVAPGAVDSPFASEGVPVTGEAAALALADGSPFPATVVVEAPYAPHVWGSIGDLLVTVDGDLSEPSLRTVAGSLEAVG
jgi:hypothetical protein